LALYPARSFAGLVDKDEGRLILQCTMLLKSAICLAAIAFAAGALLPTRVAVAGRGGVPMEGTWNWPPYAGSEGGMAGKLPAAMCGQIPIPVSPTVRVDGFTSVGDTRERLPVAINHIEAGCVFPR
jgi:hypothetical protein